MIRRNHAIGCTSMLLLLIPTGAAAQTASPGGAGIPEKPAIDEVSCATGERWACRPGEPIVVEGAGLDGVRDVVLLGGRGERDDRRVKPSIDSAVRLTAVVPPGASAGRIKLVSSAGSVIGQRSLKLLTRRSAPTPAAPTPTAPTPDGVFPIDGPHDLGRSPTNDFGGARNHGGQDMFAACGTPLVAARSGRILIERFEAAAGNYVVVQDASGRSYVYMHMRDRSLVPKDGLVTAGQRIGYVGVTGRTSGCHLHFEIWTAPGFYKGGSRINPLPELTRWNSSR